MGRTVNTQRSGRRNVGITAATQQAANLRTNFQQHQRIVSRNRDTFPSLNINSTTRQALGAIFSMLSLIYVSTISLNAGNVQTIARSVISSSVSAMEQCLGDRMFMGFMTGMVLYFFNNNLESLSTKAFGLTPKLLKESRNWIGDEKNPSRDVTKEMPIRDWNKIVMKNRQGVTQRINKIMKKGVSEFEVGLSQAISTIENKLECNPILLEQRENFQYSIFAEAVDNTKVVQKCETIWTTHSVPFIRGARDMIYNSFQALVFESHGQDEVFASISSEIDSYIRKTEPKFDSNFFDEELPPTQIDDDGGLWDDIIEDNNLGDMSIDDIENIGDAGNLISEGSPSIPPLEPETQEDLQFECMH